MRTVHVFLCSSWSCRYKLGFISHHPHILPTNASINMSNPFYTLSAPAHSIRSPATGPSGPPPTRSNTNHRDSATKGGVDYAADTTLVSEPICLSLTLLFIPHFPDYFERVGRFANWDRDPSGHGKHLLILACQD